MIAFDIASGRTTRLTQDGDPGTVDNGGARWSPDGQWISYVQYDYSAVPKRAVLVPGDPTYRTFRETRYERIGGPIATLRVGVVGVAGGPTKWIELPDQPGTFYLNQVSWAGNSDELLIEKLSRSRDAREFLLASHRTGGNRHSLCGNRSRLGGYGTICERRAGMDSRRPGLCHQQ